MILFLIERVHPAYKSTTAVYLHAFQNISWRTSLCYSLRQRNRDHARRSRLKKKNTQVKLEESLLQLKDENEQLRKVVDHIFGQRDDIDDMIQEHVNRPQLNFILALQEPGNKILNSRTIQALRCRSKKVRRNYLKTSNDNESDEAGDA